MARRQVMVIIFFLLAFGLIVFVNQPESKKITAPTTATNVSSQNRITASNQGVSQPQPQVTVHKSDMQMNARKAPYLATKKRPYQLNLKNKETKDVVFLSDTPWRILVGVNAVFKKNGPIPDTEILGEVNGYWLTDGSNPDLKNFSQEKPLVVVDLRKKTVGVLTGVFAVVLPSRAQESILLKNSDLKILNAFPEIRTYFVTAAQQPFDIEEFYFFLKNEFDTESVKAEVLSRQYEKN